MDMDMDMNMKVFASFALLYIAARIGEKVAGKIGDYVVDELGEYVAAPVREYVVAPIKYYLLAPIGRRLRCLLCFRTQLKNLKNRRAKVQELVNAAEKNGEVGLPRVQKWLTSANQIIKDTENLFVEKRQLNLKLCYQRSRMAMEKTSVVDELIKKGSSFDRVSTFKSRKLILEKIMERLEDVQTNMIGIYGEGGVGKTTLVKEVGEEAKYDNLFDEVVIATVSSEPNFERIHGEIANMLGLTFDGNGGDAGRARQLFARLDDRKKRILVILDDIWEKVDLVAIGIPFGEAHKGCKVVFTCRRRDLCDEMGSEKDFSTEVLSKEEGWNLFRKLAGDSVDSLNQKNLAVEAAKKCGGLPNAIVQTARIWRKRLSEVKDVQAAKASERKNNLSEAKVANSAEIEVVKEMFGLDPPMPSPSVNNNDNSPHSFGSSTYQNPGGGLSTRCNRCGLIWASNNSMANYQKLLRGEHI